jgi:RND family efflux transporter MFP subunit
MSAQTPSILSHVYHAVIRFFAHHKTYTSFLFVMVTAVVFFAIFSSPRIERETLTATLGSIKQYVKVSGQVQSSRDVNLSFQTAGQVSFVGIKAGDLIQQGKVLATISGGDAQTSLLQAQAILTNAQATLSQLQQGPRKEELAIKQQTLENTKSTLDQSYNTLPDTIQNVDATTADVIKNKFAALFVLNNSRYTLSFSSCDQHLQSEIEQKRNALENILADFQTKGSVVSALSSIETIDNTFESSYQAALSTNDLVNSISNLLVTPCSISNSNLDAYRTSLSLIKITMTALFSDITAKRTNLITSKNAFNQARADFNLTKAGTDPYKIQAQIALVSQAEAQVATAKSGLSKTIIFAPFSGVINNVDLSTGEIVSIGKTVISMIATDGFEVDASVPEIDIAKVKIGAGVEVTLDAYGKAIVFPASVTRINPGATIVGTVPVYKVVVTFTGNDNRIKQGMTANVQIITESKLQTIAVPARFIKVIHGDQGTAEVLVSGDEVTKNIELGIRGENGLIEIKSGLTPGDIILAPTTVNRAAQKQNK